jgi:phosphatidylserine decarboxylase
LGSPDLAHEYQNGAYIIVRLCPADYHRFHFPVAGTAHSAQLIPGKYYSVSPIALEKLARVYCQNKRMLTQIDSDHFGKVLMLEVGATFVGGMEQTFTPEQRVEKGEEKGYFKFGGSTVILFFQEGMIEIDGDLLKNTERGLETAVKMGMRIGVIGRVVGD